MKSLIRDKNALRALSSLDVRAYLGQQGWEDAGRVGDKATVHTTRDAEGRQWEVLIPARDDVGDYVERMAEVLAVLSHIEDRSELAIYHDLSVPGADVLRLRAPEADDQGTIPIESGVALYQEAENVLLAAACAAARPGRRAYHVRKISEAVNYLEDVRLGQTEQGSYVLTILSPVAPALRRGEQATLGHEISGEPFPRIVTQRLAMALTAMRFAANEAAATDDFAPFEKAVEHGLNANLCESISHLIHYGNGLDLSLTWARVRPSRLPNVRYHFSAQVGRILEAAAQEFRRDEPDLDTTVAGFVIHLDRGPDEFDGNATVQVLLDGRSRRLRVQFPETDFMKVIRAFRDQKPVVIDGDIYQVGQRYELRNPRNLLVVDAPDEGERDTGPYT